MHQKGENTMIIQKEIDFNEALTNEQMTILKKLEERPIEFDEDSRELTQEELADFKQVFEMRKNERRKQTVTIRLSPKSLSKARSLGKGYTTVLSRIIENALDDDDLIRKCL